MVKSETGRPVENNQMARSYYGLWRSGGAAPALLLTATDVQFGVRILIRPFHHRASGSDPANLQTTLGFDELATSLKLCDIELSLATAVGLSARFPVITPAGSIFRPDDCPAASRQPDGDDPRSRRAARLADGGYFENTGVETGYQLFKSLQDIVQKSKHAETQRIEVRLIVLSLAGEYFRDLRLFDKPISGFTEFASPIQTLLHTRQARGHSALVTALTEQENQRVLIAPLDASHIELPLGWHMSSVSRSYIRAHFRSPDDCPRSILAVLGGQSARDIQNAKDALDRNACVQLLLRNDLMGQ
jgi:hypothetical protein